MTAVIPLGDTARYRLSVAARVVAATIGAYGLAALATVAVSYGLQGLFAVARTEAVVAGMLLSFLVFAVAAMAVFRARTAGRAWIGLAVAALPCAIVVLALGDGRVG